MFLIKICKCSVLVEAASHTCTRVQMINTVQASTPAWAFVLHATLCTSAVHGVNGLRAPHSNPEN